MWFSGLRGAIAFVLCLQFPVATQSVVTGTLAIVLLTISVLGGGTLPLLKVLKVKAAVTADRLKDPMSIHKPTGAGMYLINKISWNY